MFRADQKVTGTGYTKTIFLLSVAFIFSPAVLVISRPLGYMSVSLAAACSALCVAWAWLDWKRSSQLSIPSIATQEVNSK
jgi:hypothetical protein